MIFMNKSYGNWSLKILFLENNNQLSVIMRIDWQLSLYDHQIQWQIHFKFIVSCTVAFELSEYIT